MSEGDLLGVFVVTAVAYLFVSGVAWYVTAQSLCKLQSEAYNHAMEGFSKLLSAQTGFAASHFVHETACN